MSVVIPIYTQYKLSKNQVFKVVKDIGGNVVKCGEMTEGVITHIESNSNIFIYYRGNNFELKKSKLEEIKTRFGIVANTEIGVDFGSGEYSEKLAMKFCLAFIDRYPESVVEGISEDSYISKEEMQEWYDSPIIDFD